MSKESLVRTWWLLLVWLCVAKAQIMCPPDRVMNLSTCLDNCGILNGYNYLLPDGVMSYKICPVTGQVATWSLIKQQGSDTFYCTNEASLCIFVDSNMNNTLCVTEANLTITETPQSIFIYYGNTMVEIRYAKIGVYSLNGSITVEEGDSVTLVWEIYVVTSLAPTYELFLLQNGAIAETPINLPVMPDDHCGCGSNTNVPVIHCRSYTFIATVDMSGMYRLEARRSSDDIAVDGTVIGNDTIEVLVMPSSTTTSSTVPPTTSAIITSSSTISSSVSTSSTVSTTASPSIDTTTIILIVAIPLAVIVVSMICVLVGAVVYLCSRKRPPVAGSNGGGAVAYLAPATPTVTTTSGKYTGLYCSNAFKETGNIIQSRYSDHVTFKWLSDAADILNVQQDANCSDILIFSDFSKDEIVKEVISSGNPDHRDKVKLVQFVSEDRTPDNTLEVEGYRVVQVVGSPNNPGDIVTILNKAEYPVAKSYQLSGVEENPDRSSVSSGSEPIMRTNYVNHHCSSPDHPSPRSDHQNRPNDHPNSHPDQQIELMKSINTKLDILVDQGERSAERGEKSLEVHKDIRSLGEDRNQILAESMGDRDAERAQYK